MSLGCIVIGLPYSAMEAVAALDEVDAVSSQPEYTDKASAEKLTAEEWDMLAEEKDETEVVLTVGFAYSKDVFIGFDSDAFARKEEYFERKNNEFMQSVLAAADIKEYEFYNVLRKATLCTTVSEVEKIASLREVQSMMLNSIDGDVIPVDLPNVSYEDTWNAEIYAMWESCKARFSEWIKENAGVEEYNSAVNGSSTLNTFYNFNVLYFRTETMIAHYYVGLEGNYAIEDDCVLNSTNNWMLVQAKVNLPGEGKEYQHLKIGDRVLRSNKAGAQKYAFGLFIYDATEDTFTAIEDVDLHKYDDPTNYQGIEKEIARCRLGNRIGDADMDGEISVIDAASIQKVKARLKKESKISMGAADYDGDGVVSVIDATRIQKFLAGIE